MNQEEVLNYLRTNGESTVTQIAEDTGCNRSHIQKRLNQLHKYGLVQKIWNGSGNRWRLAQ